MRPDFKTLEWISHQHTLLLLVSMALFSILTLQWGIEKDLPAAPEADEPIYVERAIEMASSGDPNPHWFGNPGSTTIYPLAATYHLWNALRYRGMLLRPDANLSVRFEESASEFYLIGRWLSVVYAAATIFWIYKIGQNAFESKAVGLVGAGLSLLYPVTVLHSQWVRTDTSALFFGMLALWLCLLVYSTPSLQHQLLAGAAIGLAIASRYFMVTLMLVYLAANVSAFLRERASGAKLASVIFRVAVGIAATGLIFLISTPYFLLDFATVRHNLRQEARSTQLGWDGLSPVGNLQWYLAAAVPENITWPQMLLAIAGGAYTVLKREIKPILLLTYIVAFLFAISSSALHWERWVIQILPIFSLFAAHGLFTLIALLFSNRTQSWRNSVAAACIALVFILPLAHFGLDMLSRSGPSTRMLARQWIVEHLPDGSPIVTDKESAPLDGLPFEVYEQSWAPPDRPLEEYLSEGYQYIVINEIFHDFFLAEFERYAVQLQFYEALEQEGDLLAEIEPSLTNKGGVIRIYALPANAVP